MTLVADSTRDPALVAAALRDYADDLADLATHVEAASARLTYFRRALADGSSRYRRETYQHLYRQTDALLGSFDNLLDRLRGQLVAAPTWSASDLPVLRDAKAQAGDTLRTLHAQLGFVLSAGDWQSPSFGHSLTPQSGRRRANASAPDYTRGGHPDATAYEAAFVAELVDPPPGLPVYAYVTSSGISAFATVLFALRAHGRRGAVLVGASSYFENQWLLEREFGGDVHLVDESDTDQVIDTARRLRPAAVFIDTLCNAPTMAAPDLATLLPALVRTVPPRTAVVLDNSGLAAACQPLALLPRVGSKARLFVIESLNKYHQFGLDRVTGGIVVTAGSRGAGLYEARKHLGTIMSDTSVLSLPTPNRELLMRRIERIDRNASVLAARIEGHLVSNKSAPFARVVYPGLPTHACHAWMKHAPFRGGSLVLAQHKALGNPILAKRVIRRATDHARSEGIDLIEGTSFGLDVTRIYLTARGATSISQPFLRVSAGTESSSDIEIVAKVIKQALA